MLPHVHRRAQHALLRLRTRRRLTPHEIVDYGALLDMASRPHRHHAQWVRVYGYDPEQVGTVVGKVTVLSQQLGLSRNSTTLPKRLERYQELGLADVRGELIILRPNGLVRIDPHRAGYETDDALADGRPWPAVVLPPGQAPATPGGGLGPVRSSKIAPRSDDRQEILLPHKGDDVGVGAPAREPDPIDELAALLEGVAQPLPTGQPFRLPLAGRNKLAEFVAEHGADAVRAALVDVATDYTILHPIGWLRKTLAGQAEEAPYPEPDIPAEVVDAVRGCLPPGRRGEPRQLAQTELTTLAGLVERHGAAAVIEQTSAEGGVGGYDLPVQGLVTRLDRKRPARSDGRRRSRTDDREARRRAAMQVGRRRELTPAEAEAEDARRQRQAEGVDSHAEQLARWAEMERAEAEAERARAEAERARIEAQRPQLRAKLAELRLVAAGGAR